jgi:predicted flap endonuclease-1-like 5' DNA nuclease
MSGKPIFVFVFVIPLVITLAFPSFPPAQFLFDFLKIPQVTASVQGLSVNVLLYGVANGCFWLLILLAAYGVYGLVSKDHPPLEMPAAPYLKTPPPERMPVNHHRKNNFRSSGHVRQVRREFTLRKSISEYEIETIEGIGDVRGTSLKNIGILTAEDLLTEGSTKSGRRRIARKVGVAEETVFKWVCRADLLQVSGVGRQYSELLESAGVTTAKDLSLKDPTYLHRTLKRVNGERNLVRRVPPATTIRSWINDAKRL